MQRDFTSCEVLVICVVDQPVSRGGTKTVHDTTEVRKGAIFLGGHVSSISPRLVSFKGRISSSVVLVGLVVDAVGVLVAKVVTRSTGPIDL